MEHPVGKPRPGGRHGYSTWSRSAVGELWPMGWGPLRNGNISLLPSELSAGKKRSWRGRQVNPLFMCRRRKALHLVHSACRRSACFRQCRSAQPCLPTFTKKRLMLSLQKGGGLSSSPWTCLLPSRHSTFSTSVVWSSGIQGGQTCWLDRISWPVSDPGEESSGSAIWEQ